jgi:signal peptidase I
VTDAREASIGPAGLDKAPPLVPEFRATVDTRLRSPEKPENAGAPAGDSKSRSAKDRSKRRRFIEWVVVIVLAVLVAAGLRTFVVQAFFVPSGSMLPTLQIGDRIVVIKFGYTIHRGDIVVFKRPPRDVGTADKDLVKRVIGLPGETISSRASTVLINGKPLGEPWLPALTGSCAENAENIPRTKIPPGQYFVMGDCRGNSADSRTWGTLPGSLIVGRVFVSVWRFGHPYFHWF